MSMTAEELKALATGVAQAHVKEAAYVSRSNPGHVACWHATHDAALSMLHAVATALGLDPAAVTPDSVGGNKPPQPQ